MSEKIVLDRVWKRFKRYPKRPHTTLKEAVVNWWRRRDRTSADPVDALKDVSLSIAPGTVLGIIGRNGSGKSTLLRLLAGIYRPTAGTVAIDGHVSSVLSLGLGFHPDMTGRENVRINGLVLGLAPWQIEERFDEIVSFAGVQDFIDAPVRTYSSGMFVRLAFSIAAHVDPDILLLDEVIAVGDADFAQKCRARMDQFKERGTTILLVTHALETVEHWCTQGLWLDRGEVRYFGTPAEAVARYRAGLSDGT